jgi:cell wall-associated NlpC family hydrolase
MSVGARAWAAGRALVGTRFRLQGRDAASGLDCIGVIVAAYAAAGVRLAAIDDYALRGFALERALAGIDGSGLQRVGGAMAAGDVALFALPAGQLHLALIAPGRLVHADALLRRVVEAPEGRLPPPVARWRWAEER